jgi:hypothetical protein
MVDLEEWAKATFFWELTLGARQLLVAAAALQRAVGYGYSREQIARYLGVDVETVARYDQELKQAGEAWRAHVGGNAPLQLPGNVFVTDRGPAQTVYFLPETILEDIERLAR